MRLRLEALAGVTRYALVPGDPGRVERIAAHLQDAAPVHADGPFVVMRAALRGTPVIVASTGMGGASTVVAVNALGDAGVDTFIRVGGAGPVAGDVRTNDLVIATGAVRHDGASARLLLATWPAVADTSVVAALRRAATRLQRPVRLGVVHSKDSFFGEVDPASSPVERDLRQRWEAWRRLGVLASEMEAAALFALCSSRGWRAGAVLKVNDTQAGHARRWNGDADLCELAVAGVDELIGLDLA